MDNNYTGFVGNTNAQTNAMYGDPRFSNGSETAPDIKVNSAGVEKLMVEIKSNLIGQSVQEIKDGTQNLLDSLDTYWQGEGAKAFKDYVWDQYYLLRKKLEELENNVNSTIEAAATKSSEGDSSVANYFNKL